MKTQAISWWEALKENEREVLIELLYNLDLNDYIELDKDGNYLAIR